MKRLNKLAALVVLFVPSSAMSATIDQSVSFGGANAFASDFFDNFTQYSGPDTLTGVELLYNYTSNGSVSANLCLLFQDCEPANANITLQGGGAFAALNLSDTENTGITNAIDLQQTGSFNLSLNGVLAGLNVADFMGTGTVAGSLDADGTYDGYSVIAGASYAGSFTLRYTTEITPVPVPASLGLLLVGAGGLGMMSRRRRTQTT